jgi:hypothetical protein
MTMLRPRLTLVTLIILAAALTRLLPHPPNMTSITAVALFGGAYFSDGRLAFLVPFAAMFLSDLVLGFYAHMEVVYMSFALIVCIGLWLQTRRTSWHIASATLLSSVLFYLVTNFGVWTFDSLYPKTVSGLIACYVAAIPFFSNTVEGDALYTLALFGSFTLLERKFAALREPGVMPSPRPI